MRGTRRLTDEQVLDRLAAAAETLGDGSGETTQGNTALEAARRALILLEAGLAMAMSGDRDDGGASTEGDASLP